MMQSSHYVHPTLQHLTQDSRYSHYVHPTLQHLTQDSRCFGCLGSVLLTMR